MFNTTHIVYMIVATLISAAVIFALCFFKNKRLNEIAIWVLAISTIIIHFSGLWYGYFFEGDNTISVEYMIPVFPCHICMWLLVISATLLNHDGPIARVIKDFTFWGGTVCGSIGIILNENFAATPTLTDFYVLKGLLSHSTMILGCVLLLALGYVKIGVWRSLLSVLAGLVLFFIDGTIANAAFLKYGYGEFNAMFLQFPPYENLPFVNFYLIVILSLSVTFITSAIYEQITLPHEKRWYNIFTRLLKKEKTEKRA